jgi:hypothetical protein
MTATLPDSRHPATAISLAWISLDSFQDRFELRAGAGGGPLARLTIGGLPLASARVDADGHRLLFSPKGVGNRQVAVTDLSTETVLADFEWRRVGREGTLRLVEGGQLTWRRTSRWHPTFAFVDRFGNLLLRFHPDGLAVGYGIDAMLEPPLGWRDDLVLLLALGWFLLLSSGTAAPSQPAVMP